MQRVTVTLDIDLVVSVDEVARSRGYAGRSEAMRDLLRRGLSETRRQLEPDVACVATLTFVAEASVRDLGRRLADIIRYRHDLVITLTQVPLDHDAALHTIVLRGSVRDVLAFSDEITTQRGVRHDNLSIIPAVIEIDRHPHGAHLRAHEHIRT